MFRRNIKLIKTNSFFLFGPRGSGKSTLIRDQFPAADRFDVDLLDPIQMEEALVGLPTLVAKIRHAATRKPWIFIDEIQKAPRILDLVQSLIDQNQTKFILTGSSARKLKRGGANLLAGRAYSFFLHPLTVWELGTDFELISFLKFGGLPHVWNVDTDVDRVHYLRSYVSTYLKEEIAEEQIVRRLEPFARFLQVAAQTSGQVVNFSNVARDVGVSDQTVKSYFHILEDTLLGFFLPAYDRSIRKAQGKAPKFYLFDTGVLRALHRIVDQPMDQNHFLFGSFFEHFVIQQLKSHAQYLGRDFLFSFLRIGDQDEVDLIIDRPGALLAVVEIKSTETVQEKHTKVLHRLSENFKKAEFFILSRDQNPKLFGNIKARHWKSGIEELVGQ